MTAAGSRGQVGADPFLRSVEEIAAIAQNGLTFAKDAYDLERYQRLRAIAAEMIARLADLPAAEVLGELSLERHYATPKLDVRAVVMRGDAVLLVRERSDGCWTLPGGWCDVDQSPGEAVEKETLEETGLVVKATRLLALFDKRKHDHPFQIPHACKCFFLCEERGGSLAAETAETEGAIFAFSTNLPPLSLHRVTPKQIETVVALAGDPASPTAFD